MQHEGAHVRLARTQNSHTMMVHVWLRLTNYLKVLYWPSLLLCCLQHCWCTCSRHRKLLWPAQGHDAVLPLHACCCSLQVVTRHPLVNPATQAVTYAVRAHALLLMAKLPTQNKSPNVSGADREQQGLKHGPNRTPWDPSAINAQLCTQTLKKATDRVHAATEHNIILTAKQGQSRHPMCSTVPDSSAPAADNGAAQAALLKDNFVPTLANAVTATSVVWPIHAKVGRHSADSYVDSPEESAGWDWR
jgi:hypothetical protein